MVTAPLANVMSHVMSQTEIDALVADFFGAFDNRGGAADVGRLRRLMVPGGVIVNTRPSLAVWTVEEFVEPREKLLARGGRLVGFSEWETASHTEIVGDLATRTGEYRKSGMMDGAPYEGGGTKTFQFVRTAEGWRIVAFSWFDES